MSWQYVHGNLDAMCKCAVLWGGVTAGEKALRAAVLAKRPQEVRRILQEIWFNAPDTRDVYKQEGFNALCNLLDGSVPAPWEDDSDDSS